MLWDLPAKFETILSEDLDILNFCVYTLELSIWNVTITAHLVIVFSSAFLQQIFKTGLPLRMQREQDQKRTR